MRSFFYGLIVGLLLATSTVSVAAISDLNRARIILDLLKDGIVANETPYGSLELASAPIASKYADAFWLVYDGQNTFNPGTPVPTPTNAQKATFWLRQIGKHCKEVLKTARVPAVAATAATTEAAAVDAETTTDLGP